MILADKIIELRKKNGWSQEELADRLDVSRQSVSKWEGAQSVPDMNKILKLSEVFGVSTDYLLKDELGTPEGTAPVDTDSPAVRVTMEEASRFLEFRSEAASRISLGVMLCILSPILLILLSALQATGRAELSERQVVGIGVCVLLILVGIGVALFVLTGIRGKRYEFFEKEDIDTEYGVAGMAREKREKYRPAYTMQLTAGIVLCVVSVIPIFLMMSVFDAGGSFAYTLSIDFMLALIAVGVFLIIRSSMIWGGLNMLLEEGDYTRKAKEEERKNTPVASVYWSLAVAVYLGYSFISGRWDQSWIVWPVAGVLYGALIGILKLVRGRA